MAQRFLRSTQRIHEERPMTEEADLVLELLLALCLVATIAWVTLP